MKKIILFFLSIVFFLSCSSEHIKKVSSFEKKDLDEYGILVFSVSFAKNNIQELPIYILLKGETGGDKELRIDPDSEDFFVFAVKEGYYYIGEFFGENNSPAITSTSSTKEVKEIYTEKRFGVNVEKGKINYAGNIYIKDFSDDFKKYNTRFSIKQEPLYMSGEIIVRNLTTDIQKLKEIPEIKDLSLPVVVSIMTEVESGNTSFSERIGQDKKKKSEEGYGKYKWGMSLEDIKTLLELEKKVVLVVSKEEIVDSTKPDTPVTFLFKERDGKEELYRVEIKFPKTQSEDVIFSSLTEKYGQFGKREGNDTIWYTTGSKITFSISENEKKLIYESIEAKESKLDVIK